MLIFTKRCAPVATDDGRRSTKRNEMCRRDIYLLCIRNGRGNQFAVVVDFLLRLSFDVRLRSTTICEVKAMPNGEYMVRSLPSMTETHPFDGQTNESALCTRRHSHAHTPGRRGLHIYAYSGDHLLHTHLFFNLLARERKINDDIRWDPSAMRSSFLFVRWKGYHFPMEISISLRRCLLMVLSVCLMCVCMHRTTNLNIIYGLNGESFRLHMGDRAPPSRHIMTSMAAIVCTSCTSLVCACVFFQPFFFFVSFSSWSFATHLRCRGEFAYSSC